MIPIRDTTVSRSVPVVTRAIMGINVLVFLAQWQMGPDALTRFVYLYGLVPAKFTVPEISAWFSLSGRLFTFLSYMFIHGGFWHLVGNMWFLHLFGDNVEDHLGAPAFMGFYITGGIASALFHFMLNPLSNVPTIGASGAIAAVMGAYFILYPRARILTLIPIIIIPWFVEIPAFLFLGIWFIMQFFNATGSSGGEGVAWWAHVGGFVAGIFMIRWGPKPASSGPDTRVRQMIRRTKSPRLQVIQASPVPGTADLVGTLEITTVESLAGARKIVNIPWGFYKRIYRVTVPPGVKSGTRLRLAGMGQSMGGQGRGDMYLKIEITHGF